MIVNMKKFTYPPLTCQVIELNGFHYELTLIFEPIYSVSESMLAIEALTSLKPLYDAPKLSKPEFFDMLTHSLAKKILYWQFNILAIIYPYFNSCNLLVSVNINRAMAPACIELLSSMEILSPWLRLEINEYFSILQLHLMRDRFF